MTVTNIETAVPLDRAIAEREAYWQDAIGVRLAPTTLRLQPNHRDDRDSVASRSLGDLVLTDWNCPPMEGRRNHNKEGDSARRGVAILVGYSGAEQLSYGGHDITLEEGALVVVGSQTSGGFTVPERVWKRSVSLPEASLGSAGPAAVHQPAHRVHHRHSALISLFRGYLDQAWHEAPLMNARESETARAALIALALGVINSDDSSPPVSTFFDDLRQKMNEWINIKLHEGPIRVSELAAAHNVSPRTVHRAFATGGDTMTSVVRVRRLNAVRQDVIGTRMTMTAIAHRWGYYDPSHLAREFRRQFGLSPADYRSVYGY